MDNVNRFHTGETWLLVRAEHVALVLALSTLVTIHARETDWARFFAAFVTIDLIGYIPGAIAFRRAESTRISPIYHHLYNLTHNYLTAGVAAGLWALAAGHFEWAMLALPIHLSGDRGLFGNTYNRYRCRSNHMPLATWPSTRLAMAWRRKADGSRCHRRWRGSGRSLMRPGARQST